MRSLLFVTLIVTVLLVSTVSAFPRAHSVEPRRVNNLLQPRIAGGTSVEDATVHPYFVRLLIASSTGDGSFFVCGGALISPRLVLSSAQCFTQNTTVLKNGFARVGCPSDAVDCGNNFVAFSNVSSHANFTFPFNDIAVVTLNTPVNISSTVKPITLAIEKNLTLGLPVEVIGFGTTDANETPAFKLQALFSNIIQCNISSLVQANDICVKERQSGLCRGDAGNPLLFPVNGTQPNNNGTNMNSTNVTTSNHNLLVGIASGIVNAVNTTFTCGSADQSFYTRVPLFLDWIKSVVSLEYCQEILTASIQSPGATQPLCAACVNNTDCTAAGGNRTCSNGVCRCPAGKTGPRCLCDLNTCKGAAGACLGDVCGCPVTTNILASNSTNPSTNTTAACACKPGYYPPGLCLFACFDNSTSVAGVQPNCQGTCDVTAMNIFGSVCRCPPGRTGPFCDCAIDTCKNGGSCQLDGSCKCSGGFTGDTCEQQAPRT